MRPFRSFLLLLIFLACFTGLYYVIPGYLPLPDINFFIPAKLTDYLLNKHTPPALRDSLTKTGINAVIPDSTQITEPGNIHPAFQAAKSSAINIDSSQLIDSAGLVAGKPVLAGSIDSARHTKGQVRIMFYGDSQIEGDRITSYLRQSLRDGRGGTGPGLFLPLMPVMYTRSLFIKSSSNWKRYNYLSYKNGEIDNPDLGPFMTICRYLPAKTRSDEPVRASVRIVPSEFADSAAALYDKLRIFYRNKQEAVGVKISEAGRMVLADSIPSCNETRELTVKLHRPKEVRIEFEGHVSPDIFGMSLESDSGIVVDNIPQRGSAGMEFTMVGKQNLKEIYDLLKPDLFILQYGLNVVKNVREEYSYYENGLVRQLSLLKKISPGTKILVLSLTDMAAREGDSIRSYRNIPLIRDAQKQATRKADVFFWDSYTAMGGESSAGRWATSLPPLFQKDYIHFTNTGADSISKLLIWAMFSGGKSVTKDTIVFVSQLDKPDSTIIPYRNIVTPVKSENGENVIKAVIRSVFSYNPSVPFIFTSSAFWIFLLFVLAGYSLVYKKLAIRNIYLFLISLFFYFKTGGLFLFLLILVTAVDYTCGLLINGARKKWSRKFFLLLSLISNLGLLAYFKYAGLIIESVNRLFDTDLKVFDLLSAFSNSALGTSFDVSYIILPVGISFFTFQSLSYTIDVYRRRMDPVRNIIDFGFYVSFFPHLVAGPIVRASVFIPQIYQEFHLTKREFGHALFMISKGLIKKILISNFIAVNLVDRVFDAPSLYSGFENLMAIYGYGLQIYCDFSGYTDIAIGVALILGFRLPINFNSPYKATSITDFWKRWHISLSQWLKDYLYISLGGNRKGKVRTYINLMLTMLLGGLWHGASLKFIIWGALHGAGLVFNRLWNSIFGSRVIKSRAARITAIFITFQFVCFCWIFFRAESMDNVLIMLRQIGQNFSPGSLSALLPAYSNVFLVMVLGYFIHFLPEKVKESYRGVFIRIPLIAQFAVIMLIAIMLYQLRTTEVMPFIYFRF